MPAAPLTPSRILVCASAAHCARVLSAAAAARIHLHGLQPSLHWPSDVPADSVVLWALLPTQATPAQALLETHWRQQLSHGQHAFSVHMLYGSARQQAAQLAPWLPPSTAALPDAFGADCWECLDASSEQRLFQHLLQRTSPPPSAPAPAAHPTHHNS